MKYLSTRRPKARSQDGVPVVHDPALLEPVMAMNSNMALKMWPRWSNRAKVKARWRKTMPRWGQDSAKRAPREPKMGQDGAKMGPRGRQEGPRGAKMEPKWGQDGAKTVPKWGKNGIPKNLEKSAPRGPLFRLKYSDAI